MATAAFTRAPLPATLMQIRADMSDSLIFDGADPPPTPSVARERPRVCELCLGRGVTPDVILELDGDRAATPRGHRDRRELLVEFSEPAHPSTRPDRPRRMLASRVGARRALLAGRSVAGSLTR